MATEASKYTVLYVGSKGTSRIEDLADGHIHNAARKLEAILASHAPEQDYDGDRDFQARVLECLKQEIAERDARREAGGMP